VEPLDDHLKEELLSLARAALKCAGEQQPLPALDLIAVSKSVRELGVTFVTLTLDGTLRGCIGALEPRTSLAEDVQQHTYAAARHDFRFAPVSADEVDKILIEISVLNLPTPLEYSHADQLLSSLRPGIDGVTIQHQKNRATFLPQVWERMPTPDIFLSMLCEKAGLHPDHWKTESLSIQTYQVESFQETKPSGN